MGFDGFAAVALYWYCVPAPSMMSLVMLAADNGMCEAPKNLWLLARQAERKIQTESRTSGIARSSDARG
jgi:hypothetical protein